MTRELQENARAFMDRNEWGAAVGPLEEARAIEPQNPYVLGDLGFCYSRLGLHSEATTIYEQLCQLQTNVARWPYMLGYQYYAQQQYEQAISHFDRALNIDPNYIVVLYRKGYALSTFENKRGEALTVLERCRHAYHSLPDGESKDREKKHYADACYQQGKLFMEAGNHRLAQDRLREAVTLKPNEADVYYALGKSYLESDNFDTAIENLRAAQRLSEKPQHYILDRLASAYAGTGQLAQAIQIYERMPSFVRDRAYILRNMGEIYIQLQQWDKAEKVLREAIKKEHRNHFGHYYLGIVCQQQQKWQEAVKAFKAAIELRQKYYKIGFQEAEDALAALLEHYPEAKDSKDAGPSKSPPISPSGRYVGQVKKYFPDRGFGFLAVADNNKDLFFHIKNVEERETVTVGEYLEYTLGQGKKGPEAISLRVLTGES